MNFNELEEKGKSLLAAHPKIRRACKGVYQRGMYAISHENFVSEGNIHRMTPDDGKEYYFGYYDKSPWNARGDLFIALRVEKAYESPAPNRPADLVLISDTNCNDVRLMGTTWTWNTQQGCQAQWLGPDYSSRIIYNDFRDGDYCSVLFDVDNWKEIRVFSRPVYDISKDGTFALTLDFSRLHRLRPGYGYSNKKDETIGKLCPDTPAVSKLDLLTGEVAPVITYAQLNDFDHRSEMDGAEHKVNHLMINPSGDRFMLLHRWFKKGVKYTRLVTLDIDGVDFYNLSDDDFVSHCCWKNDVEIFSFLNKHESGKHYYLLHDKTQDCRLQWPELETDGHCTCSPDHLHVITDSYPNRKRIASVYLALEDGGSETLAKVHVPFRYDNDVRCDLHPRWNHDGGKVCFDSVHEGSRQMYSINTAASLSEPTEQGTPIKVVYLVTSLRNTGPINQTLNTINHLSERFSPVVVCLYDENPSDSIKYKYDARGIRIVCLGMTKAESLLVGKKKLKSAFVEIKPDIIHAVGMPPYTMAMGCSRAALFTTLRNYCFEDYPAKYGKILGYVLAKRDMSTIREQIDKGFSFVTCSESLSSIYKDKQDLSIPFIRNGVDVAVFHPCDDDAKSAMREKLSLPAGKRIYCYVGQFNERKDQRSAINGFLSSSVIASSLLLLLGGGPLFDDLKNEFGSSENIMFTGPVTNVPNYLMASDVYLSTSKSEGMPNGVLEAMAAGLPVVLSDIPQHTEVLNACPGSGFSYPLGNTDGLSAVLNLTLGCDLKLMGAAAHTECVAQFSAEAMSKAYQQKYLELMSTLNIVSFQAGSSELQGM